MGDNSTFILHKRLPCCWCGDYYFSLYYLLGLGLLINYQYRGIFYVCLSFPKVTPPMLEVVIKCVEMIAML